MSVCVDAWVLPVPKMHLAACRRMACPSCGGFKEIVRL